MEAPSMFSGSFSTHSSSSSMAEETLRTPLDVTNPSPPNGFTDSKITVNMLSSRLEMLPKHSSMAPNALRWPSVAFPPSPSTKTTLETHPDRRARRTTNASLSSTFSAASNNSLLRTTLLLATSSSSFRPHSRTFSSPTSAAAIRTPTGTGSPINLPSSSSIASTALSNLILPPAGRATSRKVPPLSRAPRLSLSLSLAAEPTTALSPVTSYSLAQFSPTANATNSLLRYGINRSAPWSQNIVAGSAKSELRRRRSREASPADRAPYSSHNGNHHDHDATDVLRRKPSNLPSISRALELDVQSLSIGAVGTSPSGGVDSHTRGNFGIDVPVQMPYHHHHGGLSASNPRGTQEVAPVSRLPGTPRSAFPVQHMPYRSLSSPSPPTAPKAVDKGKGRAFTMPLPRASSRDTNTRALTKTHFSHLLPSAKDEIRSRDLPTLDSIEGNSRLMRGKTACSSCGEVGPDFPRCGRCSEAWCSRECRMKANSASVTGKHQCKQ